MNQPATTVLESTNYMIHNTFWHIIKRNIVHFCAHLEYFGTYMGFLTHGPSLCDFFSSPHSILRWSWRALAGSRVPCASFVLGLSLPTFFLGCDSTSIAHMEPGFLLICSFYSWGVLDLSFVSVEP